MPDVELTLPELQAFARRTGAALRAPAVIALAGELGAGKTTFAQALCEGLGVAEPVTSPTYALVHEYATARGTVHHLDLYRLRDPSQLAQLGWDELIAAGGIVLVEWPDRAGDRLPSDARWYELRHVPGRGDLRRLSTRGADA